LLVGVAIIAAVVVGVVGTLWLKGTNWGRLPTPVEVLVSDVAQLSPGNPVKLRGVRIGRVGGIAVEPNGQAVRVRLELAAPVAMPPDPVVLLAPESFFGGWQAEIVPRAQYAGFDFFDAGDLKATDGQSPVLGGYALPELSRLTASAEQISANVAQLSERLEIAFNDQTAANLSQAITDLAAISQQVRDLVNTEATVARELTTKADSALGQIEEASRAARRSFVRMEDLLGDAQMDSIVTNVRMATSSIQELSENLSDASGGMGSTMVRADSTFARMDRLTARVEAGEGTIGRLLSDSTLALRTEDVLQQLNLLLQDLRENPRRYVRLSIF
jgi:phospholipid/cholesterol/gamma-HCH transport system substrate-binding protein